MVCELRQKPTETAWCLDGFDPYDILPAGLWRYADAVRYIVGRVASGPAFCPRSRKQRNGWVPLRWVDMNRLFGRSGIWGRIRKILVAKGVLESDEEYRIGEKAKWYRLGIKWLNHGLRLRAMSKRLSAQLAKMRGDRPERGDWTPQVEHLGRWLRELRVDEDLARPWVCQRKRSRRQHLTRLKVDLIQSGEAGLVRDLYGRVHSPVTNLRSKVRPALRLNGEVLIEIDVSNCQPLLLAFMAAKVLAGDWSVEHVRRLGSTDVIREPFADLPLVKWSGELPLDVVDFLEVCQGGWFYDKLAELWQPLFRGPLTKNEVKRLSFKHILFGRVRPGNPLWRAFSRRWPSVAQVLEALKREDHGTTSRASQRIESQLMIEGVVGQFLQNQPAVPIVTIHDSVLVTPGNAEKAVGMILVEFSRLGLRPHIKQKEHAAA